LIRLGCIGVHGRQLRRVVSRARDAGLDPEPMVCRLIDMALDALDEAEPESNVVRLSEAQP